MNRKLQIVSSPVHRHPADPIPAAPPCSVEAWESLRTMSITDLREMGLGVWNKPDQEGKVLMLFPGEWYTSIPEGFLLDGLWSVLEEGSSHEERPEPFVRGETDSDTRFGFLAYGIKVNAQSE